MWPTSGNVSTTNSPSPTAPPRWNVWSTRGGPEEAKPYASTARWMDCTREPSSTFAAVSSPIATTASGKAPIPQTWSQSPCVISTCPTGAPSSCALAAIAATSSLVIAGSTTSDSRSPTTSSDVVSQRNASNRSQRAAMA